MAYRIAQFIIGLALRVYYRKIDFRDLHHLDSKGPSILIANHPNTLMDALLIAYMSKQKIYFLAKATLFNSKFKLRILKRLHMIPINRAGEEKVEGVSNLGTFAACYDILKQGKRIVIFPEGSSFKERVLRTLKTGAARIALDFETKHPGSGLVVIPVGINYSDQEKFQSNVLVSVGKPIVIQEYLADYAENSSKTSRRLTEHFRSSLEKLLITAHDQLEDKLFESLREALSSRYLSQEKDDFNFLRQLKHALTNLRISDPFKYRQLIRLTTEVEWMAKKYAIRVDFTDRRFRSAMYLRQILFSFFGLFLALPVFVYGFIHNGIQYNLTDWIIGKITKEIEYYAPLAVVLGLVLYTLTYFGFIVLLHQFVHIPWWSKILYYSSLPLSGISAYYIYKYYKHVSFKWKYVLLMFNKREILLEIRELRNEMRSLLFDQ